MHFAKFLFRQISTWIPTWQNSHKVTWRRQRPRTMFVLWKGGWEWFDNQGWIQRGFLGWNPGLEHPSATQSVVFCGNSSSWTSDVGKLCLGDLFSKSPPKKGKGVIQSYPLIKSVYKTPLFGLEEPGGSRHFDLTHEYILAYKECLLGTSLKTFSKGRLPDYQVITRHIIIFDPQKK